MNVFQHAETECFAIKHILDIYDELGAVLDPEAPLPPLAERVHGTLGELVHFQDEVGTWGEATFPQATWQSILAHLREEVAELESATTPSETAEELADCLLILFHLAHRASIDLLGEARLKHAVNQDRKWGAPDANGVTHHIK